MGLMPGAEAAFVPDEKLGGYLLNPSHKLGAAKLRFLESFSFTRDDAERVKQALLAHARANPATVTAVIHGLNTK